MKNLFFILFISAVITNLIMKIDEISFERSTHSKFDIFKFELPGGKANLQQTIEKWNTTEQKEFILKQLGYDYIFMSLFFPSILVLGFFVIEIIQDKTKNTSVLNILKWVALFQLIAWLFDFCENIRLEKWIIQNAVGNMFLFEPMVYAKFSIAIIGLILPLFFLIKSKFNAS